MSSISGITSNYLQSILNAALQNSGTTSSKTSSSTTGTSSVTSTTDDQQLSPLAEMLKELQQLQKSDPAKYKQVTAQIAASLQKAADSAQSQGNSAAATQLTQLAKDFTTASTSGDLPDIQDLAKAISAGGPHHHRVHPASTDSDSSSSTDSTSSSTASETLSQYLAAAQANGTQSDSLDPTAIIMKALSAAGVSTSQA